MRGGKGKNWWAGRRTYRKRVGLPESLSSGILIELRLPAPPPRLHPLLVRLAGPLVLDLTSEVLHLLFCLLPTRSLVSGGGGGGCSPLVWWLLRLLRPGALSILGLPRPRLGAPPLTPPVTPLRLRLSILVLLPALVVVVRQRPPSSKSRDPFLFLTLAQELIPAPRAATVDDGGRNRRLDRGHPGEIALVRPDLGPAMGPADPTGRRRRGRRGRARWRGRGRGSWARLSCRGGGGFAVGWWRVRGLRPRKLRACWKIWHFDVVALSFFLLQVCS